FFIRRGEKVKTKVIIKERPLDDDTQELRERIKEDTEEMSRLRDQIIRYEKALQQSRQASVSEEQIRPLNEMIAQYQYRMQRDAKELENLKRMLAKKQFELETTKYDAQIAEGKLQPLKETITSYQEKVDLDAQELERLRGLVHSYAHELDVTKKEVQVSLRSIEDKCKALNFVIGRVYADKRGGSPEIREKIHIPREMYNEFSEIIQHPKKAEAAKLMKVLRLILAKLEQMELEEGSVFKPKKGRIPLERQKGDPVLAVLARNDNDPVIDYHAEAKLICQKLISIMEG
ncbi:TPA: hypothetical protein HA265_03860, partial [Candidatus Woesearchaeota archaeon]|nr:hypothetical protein [Candidatus Woesearchaeota archaeon]